MDDHAKTNGSTETSSHPAPETKKGRGASQTPPPDDGIPWGPLPGGGFRFRDHPTAEEFRAYALWDPNIKQEVEGKFLELAHERARTDAIADVYHRVLPDPPGLPRAPLPRTRDEAALALGRLVADTQEAVDYLLALGRNRHNDVGPRIHALTAVTRTGIAAAQLGEVIDQLLRPITGTPGRGTRKRGKR